MARHPTLPAKDDRDVIAVYSGGGDGRYTLVRTSLLTRAFGPPYALFFLRVAAALFFLRVAAALAAVARRLRVAAALSAVARRFRVCAAF